MVSVLGTFCDAGGRRSASDWLVDTLGIRDNKSHDNVATMRSNFSRVCVSFVHELRIDVFLCSSVHSVAWFESIVTDKVLKIMAEFDQKKEALRPRFKFVRHYIKMVAYCAYTHSSVPPAMGFWSFTCHPSMHCANTSLLVTSTSMQS